MDDRLEPPTAELPEAGTAEIERRPHRPVDRRPKIALVIALVLVSALALLLL